MPYASTYAEHAHSSLVLARDVIERASRELAELIEGNPQFQAGKAQILRSLMVEMVEDITDPDFWEASRQYDDSNPLRRAA